MKFQKIYLTAILLYAAGLLFARQGHIHTESVYRLRPEDPEAFYFTPENFGIRADGIMDVSDSLQAAINRVKTEKNFGILFIPEGKYRISRTIYIPGAIRLIGYGENRPEFILGENTPGYQEEVSTDKGRANYMFWFTGRMVEEKEEPRDAGAGTFYSAISNIDFRIGDGNPHAVALRTHYAQHGFVSHSVIRIGRGKAGIFDVGNELENVAFIGGDYGIVTNRTSPGWPMMIVDTWFEGQRKAAIRTNEGGMAMVNMGVKNVPVAVEMAEHSVDRLFMEKCYFEDISRAAVVASAVENVMLQVNLLDIGCKNVPVLVENLESGEKLGVDEEIYRVKDYTYGLVMENMAADSEFKTIIQIEPLESLPSARERMIPSLPAMEEWVNIRELGAKGDGETDDTEVFRDAVARYRNIYVPQGWYRLTGTLKLEPGTRLIGLHPFGTQFILHESEPAFSGFGGPVPLVESSEGGHDIINGIGLRTGGYNYRAVGCKWMAGKRSMMNDIKFVGGHGTMRKPVRETGDERGSQRGGWGRWSREVSSPSGPVYERGKDQAWDNQYWSLWVTNNGGGVFKDIWTANTYAASGLYVSHTGTPGRIYAMSIEHHVRNEVRFAHASNWKMYAFQFEEEGTEGKDCLMMDIAHCSDLMFANQWMYRTIRVSTPQPVGVRVACSRNIQFRNLHNYTQRLQVVEFPVYEMNRELPVYPWDFARLTITGNEPRDPGMSGRSSARNTSGDTPISPKLTDKPWEVRRLAAGFIFGTGLTADSRGNVYFCEHDRKRIYRWSVENQSISMLTDHPWKPFTLATDTEDNLLVIFRYDPQPGYLVDGEQETVPRLADDNPMYSGWGNSGWAAWAYSLDPEDPDETIAPLKRVPSGEVESVEKAIYPSSRWRSDFDTTVVYVPENTFVAPDGVTVIPETYDLGRSAQLSEAIPGQSFYVTREIDKTTVRLDVAEDGTLSDMVEIVPRGEYSTAVDGDRNLYVADGQIFVYDRDYRGTRRISLEERPISMAFGGADGNTLFVTTRTSLYGIRVR
ncbi:MAG: glycosyl hydrolase family 28-related protein [Bacteroidales bacterium]